MGNKQGKTRKRADKNPRQMAGAVLLIAYAING
jgi:hypothetical protein